MARIPPADVELTAALVSELVAAQRPDLAHLPVTRFAHGWDNESFRLGEAFLVRLPRRDLGVPLLINEQRWLPALAPRLPIPVPVPVFAGRPDDRFPRPWSIVPRFDGTPAADLTVRSREAFADQLADFFVALHTPAAHDAPHNPFRGVPLSRRADQWEPRIAACFGEPGLTRWREWSTVPEHPGPARWLHGDAHPMNLLVGPDGHLGAVLDWGDLCSGDPASDLATAWLTFDAAGRARFLRRCRERGDYDDQVWVRARAWALGLAAMFIQHADDAPTQGEVGRRAAAELLAG